MHTTTLDRQRGRSVRGRRDGLSLRQVALGVAVVLGAVGAMGAAGTADARRECAPVAPSMVSAEQWGDMVTSGEWSGDPRDGAEQLWPRDCLEYVETGVFLTGGR